MDNVADAESGQGTRVGRMGAMEAARWAMSQSLLGEERGRVFAGSPSSVMTPEEYAALPDEVRGASIPKLRYRSMVALVRPDPSVALRPGQPDKVSVTCSERDAEWFRTFLSWANEIYGWDMRMVGGGR